MAYTTVDNPELYFQTKLYTGDGNSTQAITLDGSENMQPDLIWIKNRTDGHYHNLNDSVRGVGAAKVLRSNTNGAEGGTSGHVSVIGSDGFTVAAGTSDSEEVNTSSDNYVAWNWKAGGSASSNSDGSITSTVSANTTAGFSIVTFTTSGGSVDTIGHGLGTAPSMIILKSTTNVNNWSIYHKSLGNTKEILFTTGASSTNTIWNNTTPTSTIFNLNLGNFGTSRGAVAYCFSEVKSFSKFGSYTGNGNADGTFVYTGFKPAWVLIKRTDGGTDNWNLYDNKRLGYNTNYSFLIPNENNAENTTTSTANLDILSNGFKIRGSTGHTNTSGGTYIFMCFAESALVNSNGVPTNAR